MNRAVLIRSGTCSSGSRGDDLLIQTGCSIILGIIFYFPIINYADDVDDATKLGMV